MKKYFFFDNAAEMAACIDQPKVDRNTIADILVRQNLGFKARPETFKAIEKLRHDNALCVFSGQQAGLYGGPLMTLYKAMGIVKRAEQLENDLHRPVIPVFWIAADDHDFEEINHTYHLNHQGELEKLSYESTPPARVPVSEIILNDEEAYNGLMEKTITVYGQTEFTDELRTRLFAAYSLESSFVNAFGRYLLDILPDMGLVMFSPADIEAKTISKGFFRRLIEGHFRMKELLSETAAALGKDGYHVQAEKKESAVHLFYHTPERIPVHFRDDTFVVGEKTLGINALLDLIDRRPEKFSPDVLSRPLWQSYLFPVVGQSGGPSEIAYFCQIGKLFELFNLTQPYYYFRPALTIIEKRQEELLNKYNLGPGDLNGDIEKLINRIAAQSFPKEMEKNIAACRTKIEQAYKELSRSAGEFDPGLEPMSNQTYGKIDFALNSFEKKIYDHHKQKMESSRQQIYRLAAALYPKSDFQERTLNINYYISKYGFKIVDYITGKIDIETKERRIIYLSEFTD